MDVLSSMATAAGYQAVLKAATKLPPIFPHVYDSCWKRFKPCEGF